MADNDLSNRLVKMKDDVKEARDASQAQISRLSRIHIKTLGKVPSLRQASQVVKSLEDEEWLLGTLPYKVVAAILIYSGSKDGWKIEKFH